MEAESTKQEPTTVKLPKRVESQCGRFLDTGSIPVASTKLQYNKGVKRMYHKTISYRHKVSKKHMNKRIFIGTHCMHWEYLGTDIKAQGKLRKGKIHCSCPICSCKSTTYLNKTTNSLAGYSAADKRKFASLDQSYNEYISA